MEKVNFSSVFADAIKADKTNPGRPESDILSVKYKIFVVLTLLLIFTARYELMAADRYSVQTGPWSDINTWSDTPGGGGGFSVPAAGDDVFISNYCTVELDVNTEALNLLSIESGCMFRQTLNYTVTATTITVNGQYRNLSTGAITVTTMNVNSGGLYLHESSANIIPTANWSPGSTCFILGWTDTPTLTPSFDQDFYNFTWECPDQAVNVSFGGYVANVAGTFTLRSTNAEDYSISPGGNPTYNNYVQTGGQYDVTFGTSIGRVITVSNDFTISGGRFLQSYDAPVSLNVGRDYTMSGGSHYIAQTTGSALSVARNFLLTDGRIALATDRDGTSSSLRVAGNFTHTGGEITEYAANSSGTIVFNGNGNQIYTSGGLVSNTINFVVGEGANLPYLQLGTGASPGILGSGSIGTFTILEGATLGITSPEGITASGASGNIQVSGTRTYNDGSNYVYNGSALQVTGDGLAQTLQGNLTIANDAGVALSRETSLSGVLNLTSGTLNTGSYTLIVDNPAPSAIIGGSAASYINGTLRRSIAGGTNTYTYPLGTSSGYAPVSIAFGAGTSAGYLNGTTSDGIHSDILNSRFDPDRSVNRTWSFSVSSGLGTIECGATLTWAVADQDVQFDYLSAFTGLYSGSSWSYPTVGAVNEFSIEVAGLTGFGDFQVGNDLVINEPTVPASGINFTNVTETSMTISWTNGNGTRRIVVVNAGGVVDGIPLDGTSYAASAVFGSGAQIGTGNYVVYNSFGNSVLITGLTRGADYHIAVFEYNGSAGLEDYAEDAARANMTTGNTGDYRSAQTGNWSNPSIWERFDGTSWVAAASYPTSADNQVTILGGHIVTVTENVSVDQVMITAGGRINVSSGATLTVTNGVAQNDMVVDGILDNTGSVVTTGAVLAVNDGGIYIHSTSGTNLPTVLWNNGSTCEITGWTNTTSLPLSFNQSFYNFTWNCSGQAANVNFSGRVATVNGTFTLSNTNGYSIRPGGSPTYESYIQTGGIYIITSNESGRTVTVLNDFLISGGTFNMSSSTNALLSGYMVIFGDFSSVGGTITETGTSSGSIFFEGANVKTYSSGGSITETIGFFVNDGAFLQIGTGTTVVLGYSFDLTDGGTLGITSVDGIALVGNEGCIQTQYRSFAPGANYIYNGITNQNTGTGLATDLTGSLTINNPGPAGNNIVTLNNAIATAAGGSVNIVNGVFNAGTNLTMATISTINRSGGSMTGIPQGTGSYNVNYSGNSMTTTSELSGSGLNSLTSAMASGQTLTLSQNITPRGDLEVTSGILDLNGNTCDRSVAGGALNVSAGATLSIGGANTMPANFGTYGLAATSTIEYRGAAQTVAPVQYGNLVLSGTGRKTINAGSAVSVATNLTTGDLLTIESSGPVSNGSLIVNGESTGDVTYNRALREGDEYGDRHLFSSPVGSQSISEFIAAYDLKIDALRVWNEIDGIWTQGTSGNFISGQGYNVYQTDASDGLFSFTGPVVTGATVTATSPYAESYQDRLIEFPDDPWGLTDHDLEGMWALPRNWTNWGGGGWNLLGNPFTSAMDAEEFISENSISFDPSYLALYLYDGVNGVYSFAAAEIPGYPVGDPHGSIVQAGQGFMVMANNNGAQFVFDRSMQTSGPGVAYLKSAKTDNPWPGLKLKVQYGEKESLTTVIYNDEMTTGLDPGYDIGQLSTGPAVEIYTMQVSDDNSINLARQALPVFGADTMIIPVGIDSRLGGEVTFSAYTVPLGRKKFWLEDRTSEIFTDLTSKSYRTIIPENTYGTGRFFIHASVNAPNRSSIPREDLGAGLRIWAYNGEVLIKGELRGKALCTVYDLHGQKVTESKLVDGQMNTVTMPVGSKGVYIVRVTDGSNITHRKIVFP